MARGAAALKKRQRDLMIGVGAVIIVVVAFLLGSGYVTFAFPFSFAVKPYVKISVNEAKTLPVFGGYNTTLGLFDIYSKFAPDRTELKQIEFKVRLVPKASQEENGLRNFSLNYWSCRPSKGPSYGYSQQNCEYYYKQPVSVRSVAEYTIVTFSDMQLPVYSAATQQGFGLYGSIARTGRVAVGNRTPEVSVRIHDAKEVLVTAAGSNTPINVRYGKRDGGWLKILAGYGYPLRYNQSGAPAAQGTAQ